MNELSLYKLENEEEICSPALVYYQEYLKQNIEKTIEMAGGASRLWPHVKTHKCRRVVEILQSYGVTRFKAAVISEAEMLGDCGAEEVILAYPLIGPNIRRFLALQKAYPHTRFWAIQEDLGQIRKIGEMAVAEGTVIPLMVDVNPGMNRTGIPIEKALALYEDCLSVPGVAVGGFHSYDGHHIQSSVQLRKEGVCETVTLLRSFAKQLTEKGYPAPLMVATGTPAFPFYRPYEEFFVSPGTLFLNDYGYQSKYEDIPMTPAGLVFARCISHPAEDMFTIDVGAKAIAADPIGLRGYLVDYADHVETVFQNEEHWVLRMKPDSAKSRPEIGQAMYVIPTHICPTSALYPEALVAQDGKITETWPITARNRKITI